jgi:hypothetical protein
MARPPWCRRSIGAATGSGSSLFASCAAQIVRGAGRRLFVAQDSYTADAVQFAAMVGMTLIDGEELRRVIGTGLRGAHSSCPRHPPSLSLRTARAARPWSGAPRAKGQAPGHEFWGCSAFPACRSTAPIPDQVPVAL